MDRYLNANAVLSMFSKNYMELKKGLPIRPSEMGVLNIITETDGQYTPVMLAKMLNISKPMITAHITSLVNKGYITKEPSSLDKRAYYILPTDKGRDLVEDSKEDLNRQLMLLEENMGRENFDSFVALVKSANEIIKKENLL